MQGNNYSNMESAIRQARGRPRISATIVIPFYGDLNVIDKTLVSLTLQTYPRELWDVIIAEDGNLHSTQVLLDKYFCKFKISRVFQDRNGYRVASARNLGITAATGDVIILLDADCVCLPEHIFHHLKWFSIDMPVATFGLREFVDLQEHLPDQITEWLPLLPKKKRVHSASNRDMAIDRRVAEIQGIKLHPFPCNCFHGCNVAFWRSDAIRVGLFDTDFDGNHGYEDIEFAYRLHQQGCFISYVPEATVYHHENSSVLLSERAHGRSVNLEKLYAKVPGLREYRLSIGLL